MALKLTISGPSGSLAGIDPGAFTEVRVQDTARGGTRVQVVQANGSGNAPIVYPGFDENKNVHVRILVSGKDSVLHHLVFAKESTSKEYVLIDPDEQPTAPSPPAPATIADAFDMIHRDEQPTAPDTVQGV